MTGPDLRSYVNRTQTLLETTPPTTASETRTLLVDPFLETLGWNVHTNSCRTNVAVDGCHLEYAFSVDSVPALFVAVEPFEESLSESRAVDLLEAMGWTGVDRAIYTNGRNVLFLAGTTDVDRLACNRESLLEHETSIGHFTHNALEAHLEHHAREFVARRLALERATLVDSIVETLQEHAGESGPYDTEFEAATERFLDKLVVSFAHGEADRSAAPADIALEFTDETTDEYTTAIEPADSTPTESAYQRSSQTDESPATGGDAADQPDVAPSSATDSDSTADPASPSSDQDANDKAGDTGRSRDDRDPSSTAETDEDGEYVVRFFNDRGSIGAIGHSSSRQALVHAAEYLFERGLSGVRVPWSPDDGDRTVLNDGPTRADGSPMDDPQELSNGLYLETGGTVATQQARVDALTSRAGLRAMLTGEWDGD